MSIKIKYGHEGIMIILITATYTDFVIKTALFLQSKDLSLEHDTLRALTEIIVC